MQVIPLPYRAPRANAFAERWVRSARREVLDHLLIFGCRHLDQVLREYVDYYQRARPHQGLGQRIPDVLVEPEDKPIGPVVRRDRLGGLLHEYMVLYRAA